MCHVSSVMRYMLYIKCCNLYIIYCVSCVMCHMLYILYFLLYILYCTLFILYLYITKPRVFGDCIFCFREHVPFAMFGVEPRASETLGILKTGFVLDCT